jgi:sugar phosphate isomerase/epimerase
MSWNVRIGINPLSWMNDDLPSLGGETPLETALKEGAEIGYAGFELGNKFPKTGPELKAKLAEFGLVCVSGWYSGILAEVAPGMTDADALAAEIERCRAHLTKLQHNDVKVVVYGECAGTIQAASTRRSRSGRASSTTKRGSAMRPGSTRSAHTCSTPTASSSRTTTIWARTSNRRPTSTA